MPKIKFLFAASIIIATFAACDKNELENNSEIATTTNLYGLNVFSSAEELQNLIHSSSSTEQYNKRWKGKESINKVKSTSEEFSDNIIETEELLADLIPNENFRNIVNEKGEFIVGTTIYKICKFGTLYTDVKYKDELELINQVKIDNSSYIDEKLKKIGNVYLYETFANHSVEDNYTETDKMGVNGMQKAIAATTAEPNINSFPVKSASRHTIVGGWLDAIFGEDIWRYETIASGKRLGAKLYDYNYVVTKETGFSAKVQHNGTWFGTWGLIPSWSDGITIGWEDMLFKITIPEMEQWQKPKNIPMGTYPKYTEYITKIDFSKTPFAVGNNSIVIPFIGETNFTDADLQEMIYKFAAGQLISALNSARNSANGLMVDVPSRNTRYIYIAKSNKWYNGREVNHVYMGGVSFEIYAGNQGDFYSYMLKSMTASQSMKHFELISGKAYAYVQYSGVYKGMIVKKIAD
ncbi:MAG: hypothetical protein LBN23_01895 [Paludibacter sp.]|jgi:hypothetical protein|nr:hypothetical protein [Paludibacter sp.]